MFVSVKGFTYYRARGSDGSTFMFLYVTGDMTRRESAPSETVPLDNKTRHIVTPCSSDGTEFSTNVIKA